MEKNWNLVFFTVDNYWGDLAIEIVGEYRIPSVIDNQEDSCCYVFSDIKLNVSAEHQPQALKNNTNLNTGNN